MVVAARTRYDTVALTLHWLIAALMIFMLVFGEDLIEVEEYGSTFAPSMHVSIGLAILALTIFRLVWRIANPPPAYPASMAPWEKMAAKATHLLFYVLLIVVPMTGWLAMPEFLQDERIGTDVMVFGAFPLPAAPNFDLSMDDLHELTSNTTLGLLILYVLAAFKHHFINRDDVLPRILPRAERK